MLSFFKMVFLVFIVIYVVAGCVSTPPIIAPDAIDGESISAIGMSCKKPYMLKHDCSGFSGPKKKVTLSNVKFKVAGSEDGRVIVMFGGKSHGSKSETSNLAYEIVKKELLTNGVRIIKITPIVSANILFGYALETDKAGYSLLDKYAD